MIKPNTRPHWNRNPNGTLTPRNSAARFISERCRENAILVRLHPCGAQLGEKREATGKEPTDRSYQLGPAVDESTVRKWILDGHNYGILPGRSGLAVLDIEPAGLGLFPRECIPSDALLVRTPSGGLHPYLDLKAVETVIGGPLRKVQISGAELFGHTGHVVCPGSIAFSSKSNSTGPYVVEQEGAPLADPDALRILLAPFLNEQRPQKVDSHRGRQVLEKRVQSILKAPEGQRHSVFIREASNVYAHVAAGSIPEKDAEEALRDAYKKALPDELADMDRCLEDARRYGFDRPWHDKDVSAPQRWWRPDELPLFSPENDIVRGFIGPGELACLAGPSGSGKSFLAIALSVAIAGDHEEFLGQRVQRHGPVLYLATEGVQGLRPRIAAADPEAAAADRLLIYAGAPQLIAEKSVQAFLESARDEIDKRFGGTQPVLIVIDTLANAIAGAEENSNTEMSQAIQGARKISEEFGAAVLLIHHSPKKHDAGTSFLRGASALLAGVEIVLGLKRVATSPSSRTLETEKQRDRNSDAAWNIEFEVFSLGDSETLRLGEVSRTSKHAVAQREPEKRELKKRMDEENALLAISTCGRRRASFKDILTKLVDKGMTQKGLRIVLQALERRELIVKIGAGPSTRYVLTAAGENAVERIRDAEEEQS